MSNDNLDVKILELESKIDEGDLPETQTQQPKKRGRKPKVQLEESKPEVKKESFDISGLQVTSTIMSMICVRLPNPLPLTPEESDMLNKFGDKVFNKYLGTSFEYGEEIILGLSVLMVLYPRIKKEEKTDEERKNNT